MEFDHAAFLVRHFRDPLRLQAVVRLYLPDNVPEESTVRKWFSRGSVPGGWLALLLVVLELDTGKAVSLKPFVRG
jgi:hypothetical protein